MAEGEVTIPQLHYGQSTMLAGLATGCMVVVPCAVKFGRRPIYTACTAILAATCWWSAKRHSYAEVILTNLLLGLAASITTTVSLMTVSPAASDTEITWCLYS